MIFPQQWRLHRNGLRSWYWNSAQQNNSTPWISHQIHCFPTIKYSKADWYPTDMNLSVLATSRCLVPVILTWNHLGPLLLNLRQSGLILYMRPANERRRYTVTSSLIGWSHIQTTIIQDLLPTCMFQWWPSHWTGLDFVHFTTHVLQDI